MKPQILLIGTDHLSHRFAGSDPDEEYLKGLDKLRQTLINYKPTRVCIEMEADDQTEINASYERYKVKSHKFFKNESYDLGFYIAMKSRLGEVVAMDRMSTEGKSINVSNGIEWAKSENNNHPFLKKLQKFQNIYEDCLTINNPYELFLELNKESLYTKDETLYSSMISLGENIETSIPWLSWWYKRNLIMTHYITKDLIEKDKVIVIVGQSHLYILKQMLEGSDDYNVLTFYDYVQKEG